MHPQRVIHVAQLIGVIHIDVVLQERLRVLRIVLQRTLKATCSLRAVQLIVIYQTLDELGGSHSVLVASLCGIVMNLLCHLNGLV